MNIEQVRKVWHAEPFHPFTIHLADGRSLTVHHPEFLARTSSGRHVVVTHPDQEGWDVVDLLLVTSIEQRVKPNGNDAE